MMDITVKEMIPAVCTHGVCCGGPRIWRVLVGGKPTAKLYRTEEDAETEATHLRIIAEGRGEI